MNKTKIEWCDFTWNPVTGCRHGCKYCYAKRVYKRFSTRPFTDPLFWDNRLDQPARRKKPARIFVVSMGDLFGDWVPDSWIERVFEACEAAPQHTYFFLTKNPKRTISWVQEFWENKNYWIGISATNWPEYKELSGDLPHSANDFISLEPLINWDKDAWLCPYKNPPRWLIVGSETKNGRPVNVPKREWLLDIRKQCADLDIPLFEKNSLAGLALPGGLIQQWPESAEEGL